MTETESGSRSSGNQFEALFNYATMGILLTDSQGRITAINPFALNEFGFQEKELIGKPVEVLIPGRYNQHVKHREMYLEKPVTRPMGVGMDLFGLRKDGTEFPVEISLGSFHNQGELFVIAFISNISVRKKAESDIKKLNDELESLVDERTKELTRAMHELERSKEEVSVALNKEKELSELKSRFVSMASHEFRTPLSTVLSSSYLIQKYVTTEDQPKRERHIQRIISSVNMLTDILNDFLSLGKIEEGKILVRPSEFNIQEKMNAILSEISNNLKAGQRFNYQHNGTSLIYTDLQLLKHIILNLVSNASKFSEENSPIDITTSVDPGLLKISVKDYGMGISKSDQKHLMERFFRGANAMNIQGTGLGLHIVSKYVELMDGEVECHSELEKGTEFILSFNTPENYEENINYRGQ